jgi:hypothetical protein
MAKTKLRDIEICVEEGILKVIPYKLFLNEGGYLEGDYSSKGQGKILSVAMNRKDNKPLIDFILDVDHSLRGDWEGFSEWDTTERFYDFELQNDTIMPERLKKWLEAMPFYEVGFYKVEFPR